MFAVGIHSFCYDLELYDTFLAEQQKKRGGFNLECGKLKNGKLKYFLVSKNVKTGSPKRSNGKLEFSLENSFLENSVGNRNKFML
jgi:hypothetical protein